MNGNTLLTTAQINDYNPIVTAGWGSNTDVQFVGETSAILNMYITAYVTKEEKGQTQEVWKAIDDTSRSKHARLKSIGYKLLQGQEVGIYEAYLKATGMSYIHSNVPTVDITLGRVGTRKRCLKTGKQFTVSTELSQSDTICCRSCHLTPWTHSNTV